MDVTYPLKILRVVDGETYECEIRLPDSTTFGTVMRLSDYDTLEQCRVSDQEKAMAKKATDFAEAWCRRQWPLSARWQGRMDAYCRLLVEILGATESLGEELAKAELAVRHNDESRRVRRSRMEDLVASRIIG